MTVPLFDKVVIFGVGLIGGSFALALHKANVVSEVVGFGRSEATLQQAQQLGIINRIGQNVAAEVGDANLVLLAMPVAKMAAVFSCIAPHLGSHTLVTDAGSTKRDVVAAAYTNLGDKVTQFVPAHPIAGGEKSGSSAAFSDLYQGKKVVLTPLPENSPETVARISQVWTLCGATVSELTPQQHDEVFAAVSHLPHLLSFALVNNLAKRDNRELLFSFAASGFRDFTRIAESSPEVWRDISLANRDALLCEFKQYSAELNLLSQALENSDAAKLEEIFSRAREVRSEWADQ